MRRASTHALALGFFVHLAWSDRNALYRAFQEQTEAMVLEPRGRELFASAQEIRYLANRVELNASTAVPTVRTSWELKRCTILRIKNLCILNRGSPDRLCTETCGGLFLKL